jgi:hypothetical protein
VPVNPCLVPFAPEYRYNRGEFVMFTTEELKALDVESSKVIEVRSAVLDAADRGPSATILSPGLEPGAPVAF